MQRWEYKTAYVISDKKGILRVVKIDGKNQPDENKPPDPQKCPTWEQFLEEVGLHHWELVGITGGYSVAIGSTLNIVFKQPKEFSGPSV
jgi:hypothetical protein